MIAATGLVILLKLDSNHRFFSQCDLEIWWMTPKNNPAPLLCYFKLFASLREFKLELQSGNVKFGLNSTTFFSRMTLKFDWWPWKTMGTSSMLFQALCIISYPLVNSNWSYSLETPNLGLNQGWGQFHFFNSIPIPLFSIPIPIPLLPISFNSNSNSGHFNSNSGEFKSNLNSRNDLLMSSSKLIVIIITRFIYIKSLLLIPSDSYPLCIITQHWLILNQ